MTKSIIYVALLVAMCGCGGSGNDNGTTAKSSVALHVFSSDDLSEIVDVNFDKDIPGQPPLTGGPGQPTFISTQPGTTVVVEANANGIATQPVVVMAQTSSQVAHVATLFNPIPSGVVRIEATVGFSRLADGFFLQTVTNSGASTTAVVTRLIVTSSGEIQNNKTRTIVGRYSPNEPFRVRMDIDMTSKTWSVAVDNELNGFADDPVLPNLPFENALSPPDVLPAVGGIYASLSLFPTNSIAPTSVAYDDIQAFLLAVPLNIQVKPAINPGSKGVIPVAILSTATFDASTVDPATVLFGRIGTNAAAVSFAKEDVNGDGKLDMVFKFRTQDTDIKCGDTLVSLTGETFSGQVIEGTDTIKTVGCR